MSADWCEDLGDVVCCGTRMIEHSRTSFSVPDGLSYYGPDLDIVGEDDDCTDLFPGWSREWSED